MQFIKLNLSIIFSLILFSSFSSNVSFAQENSSNSFVGLEEIIVTAQKREQNINEVGMSIDVASGQQLENAGIKDMIDLGRLVSGFTANSNYYGTYTYTIRGVGFQDTALASNGAVSINIDEMPIPFSALTTGVVLDIERVEVLKGPQGTLFGQNTTGGAINYIANKPTDEFEAGIRLQYGSFNEIDITGFISGPISENLSYRLAAKSWTSDGDQKMYSGEEANGPDPIWVANGRSYTYDKEAGEKDFQNMRLSFAYEPADNFSALLTLSAWRDQSDSRRPQFISTFQKNPVRSPRAQLANYPRAPKDNRAADWGPCVNAAGGKPENITGNIDIEGNPENLNNRLLDNCKPAARDNEYFSATLRMDYDVSDSVTLTSQTSYNTLDREQLVEADGTIYQNYESIQTGDIEVLFQELRLSGNFSNDGTWVVGANYERTETYDKFIATYGFSTAVPVQVFTLNPLCCNGLFNDQETDTMSIFGSMEYPIMENLDLTLGIRYTDQERSYVSCGIDGGDGSWTNTGNEIQSLLQLLGGYDVVGGSTPIGGCGTASLTPPTFHAPQPGYAKELNEDNVSWKVGFTYDGIEDSLYWFTVTQGFKSGSSPMVASASEAQHVAVVQEELLAYELGTKLTLQDGRVQLNAAAFFYDYKDKQVLGAFEDLIFGSLGGLVNVPESEITGFEASLEWYPTNNFRVVGSLLHLDTEITGEFRSFDRFSAGINAGTKNFKGQELPAVPDLYANFDFEYTWQLNNGNTAFIGTNVSHRSDTKAFFYDQCNEPGVPCTSEVIETYQPGDTNLVINSRTLVDIRAGVEFQDWTVQVYGQNIFDKYYWNWASAPVDTIWRYTGLPRTYGIALSRNF